MVCTRCGRSIPEALHCKYCGQSTQSDAAVRESPPPAELLAGVTGSAIPAKLLWSGLAVLAILGIGAVLYLQPKGAPATVAKSEQEYQLPVELADIPPISIPEEAPRSNSVSMPVTPAVSQPTAPSAPAVSTAPIPAPAVELFRADAASVEAGSGTYLRWSVNGARSVQIQPGIGVVESQGEAQIVPAQTTTYELIAESAGGEVAVPFTITVVRPGAPQILSFNAEPSAVARGESAFLRWSVSGRTTRVSIEPGIGAVAAQGEREVHPTATTRYELIAEGPGGRVSLPFTLRLATPPKPTITFVAEPNSIRLGETARLRWDVTGASSVRIQPASGPFSPAGVLPVRPTTTTRYVLTADGPGGTATSEATVQVAGHVGPSTGELTWTGTVRGTQIVTVDRDRSDIGQLQGSLPGVPCIVLPADTKKVAIASPPSPRNNYERLVFRVTGNGPVTVVIKWSLQ